MQIETCKQDSWTIYMKIVLIYKNIEFMGVCVEKKVSFDEATTTEKNTNHKYDFKPGFCTPPCCLLVSTSSRCNYDCMQASHHIPATQIHRDQSVISQESQQCTAWNQTQVTITMLLCLKLTKSSRQPTTTICKCLFVLTANKICKSDCNYLKL